MNAASGRFWNADSYEGARKDPISLHKYLYCNGDAANFIDPGGHWTAVESAVANSIASIVMGMQVNAAKSTLMRGRVLADSDGKPIDDALLILDLVELANDVYLSVNLGKLAVLGPLTLFKSARKYLAGVAKSGGGLVAELATTPLAKNITDVADDALVTFGGAGYSTINPGAGGESFAFRFGDIKHLTPRQIETVIGPLSNGGLTGGARVMHVLDAPISSALQTAGAEIPEFSEYVLSHPVKVPAAFIVQ